MRIIYIGQQVNQVVAFIPGERLVQVAKRNLRRSRALEGAFQAFLQRIVARIGNRRHQDTPRVRQVELLHLAIDDLAQ